MLNQCHRPWNHPAAIRPIALFGWIVICLAAGQLAAQVQIQAEARPAVQEEAVEETEKPAEPTDESTIRKNEEKYAGGAALKTDSDLEDQLKKATAFVAEENYRYATILWDRVLEKSDNSLVTRDGETYISLVREVEETIRNLPPSGLQIYRVSADGKARALMPGAPAEADDQALNQLVRLYFMSSIGDDAAFELGCRALDQRDFVSASRLFNKILNEHPDPSVDRNQVLIRLAIAAGNLGDRETASRSLAEVDAGADDDIQALASNAQKHLEYLRQSRGSVSAAGDAITMRLSGPQRSGVMPDLPDDVLNGDLTQGYEFRFPLDPASTPPDAGLGEIIRGGSSERATSDSQIDELSKKWKSEKWFPANQLLYADGRIVLKTPNDLVCIDSTGDAELTLWHSLWLNHFMLDEASWNAKTYGQQIRNRNGSPLPVDLPSDEKEAWYFFDRIHQSMAINQGMVFTIEGESYSQLDEGVPRRNQQSNVQQFNQPVNLTRARTNYLTAYNLRTGKVVWTRAAGEDPAATDQEAAATDDTASKVGFLGTPVPFGNLVLCPVTEGGAISIYAMDATDQGKTVWKTFLCDDPSIGVDHFAPVEVTIDGQDAYVTCGTGVLFSLNAATGNIQFARRYTRDGEKKKIQTSYNQFQELLIADGWNDNVVVTWKNALIVMASDHDYVFAVDRRNGKFLWDAPRLPFDEEVSQAYCLGHTDDKLVMATNKAILCYNLAGDGKLHWYQKFAGNAYGRGFITSRAVYVPVEDTIVKYDLETGKQLARVGVNLGSEAKVGNLFSDGNQIWVAGLNRVVALRSLRDRLAELESQITAGNTAALQERLGIHAKLKEYDQAFQDAVKLYEMAADKPAAFQQLVQNLKTADSINQAPQAMLDFLDRLISEPQSREVLQPTISEDYQVFFESAKAAAAAEDSNAVQKVLGWSGYEISDGFRSAVTKFLTNHPPTADGIRQIVEQAAPPQQQMLIPVLAKVESAGPILVGLLDSPAEAVRIAAANELALKGNKACVKTAVDLLSSDNPTFRVQAYLILKNITGADIEFQPNGSDEERAAAIKQWQEWVEQNFDSLEVSGPVRLRFGKMIIGTTSKILEFDLDNGLTRETELKGFNPEDVVTARNGNRIVVEYSRQRITELDLAGEEVNRISTAAFPRSARKLPNGNYLVAWRNQNQPVVELDAQGRTVWETKNLTGYALSAERLPSGNTLIAFEDRVVEIDSSSRVLFEIGRAQGVASCKEARRLPDGNTLVVYGTSVSVFDANKNPVLRIRGSFRPKCAARLDDGRILVGHDTGLRVFDKEGTKIGDDYVNENVNSIWDY